jgi:ABC-type multidrug transport system fused ATPase/permease subunit
MEDFLTGEELQKDARLVEPAVSADLSVDHRAEMVTIQNGEFRWLSTAPEPTLRDINLSVNKGELVTVLGRVGDGKVSERLFETRLTNAHPRLTDDRPVYCPASVRYEVLRLPG